MRREHHKNNDYNENPHRTERGFREGRFHHDGRGRGPAGFGPGAGWGFGGQPGGWGGPGPRRRPKGDVRTAILSILGEGEAMNGYAIMKAIGEKTDGAWRVSPGSVYPNLQQLVDEGLIASTGEGRGTVFELTDEGRTHLAEHEDEVAAAWSAVPRPSASATELFESIGKLMGVVGQFRQSATDEQRAAATAKIDEARRALYLILAD